jgi:NAD(P)H-flavin reductase
MATVAEAEARAAGAMTPEPYRVISRVRETTDTWTLGLEPLAAAIRPAPGQFDMLWAFGVGEVPISTSGLSVETGDLLHTIRAVGPVTRRLCAAEPGDVVGIRGPFGTAWPVAAAVGGDLVIVAGGIGLAPVRPAVYHALAHRADYGSVCLLVGARTPADLLYRQELEAWRGRFDVDVDVTVDSAEAEWRGRVGLVTKLIPDAPFDPARATAFVVGPELMMRFTVGALVERGVPKERIHVSMERNMRCGVGHCGHCQLGPKLICRDGPVFPYPEVEELMEVREL